MQRRDSVQKMLEDVRERAEGVRKQAEKMRETIETLGNSPAMQRVVSTKPVQAIRNFAEQVEQTLSQMQSGRRPDSSLSARKSIATLSASGATISGQLRPDGTFVPAGKAGNAPCTLRVEATRVAQTEEEAGTPPATPRGSSRRSSRR